MRHDKMMNSKAFGVEESAMSRADSAGVFAELGSDDAGAGAAGTPFEAVEALVEWIEERGAGLGDAAADHNHFGIEHVDEAGDGRGKGMNGCEPGIGGFFNVLDPEE